MPDSRDLVLIAGGVLTLAITLQIDRLYRWHGARPITRAFVWAVPIAAYAFYLSTRYETWSAPAAIAMLLAGFAMGLWPRALIAASGGPIRLVALGERVREIGLMALAIKGDGPEGGAADETTLRALLQDLGDFDATDTHAYVVVLREQMDRFLATRTESPAMAADVYRHEKRIRTALDAYGVGPWSWYWVRNAEVAAEGDRTRPNAEP